MKLWESILALFISLTFLTNTSILAGSSFRASTTINLSDSVNQSGRHAVCLDEDVVYSCSSFSDSLTWNVYYINGDHFDSVVFVANDSLQLEWLGQAVAILLNNTPKNLTSQLVIPYTPRWNGTTIECMNGDDSQCISYTIAGTPLSISPTSFWYTVSTSEQFLTLQWSLICDNDVDCSIIKIVINGINPLNVSYPTNLAILDISEYPSEDPIEIAIYAINKCSMMSEPSTRIVNIGNSTQDVTIETCRDKIIYTVLGVGGPLLVIGLVLGAIIMCLCKSTNNKIQLGTVSNTNIN